MPAASFIEFNWAPEDLTAVPTVLIAIIRRTDEIIASEPSWTVESIAVGDKTIDVWSRLVDGTEGTTVSFLSLTEQPLIGGFFAMPNVRFAALIEAQASAEFASTLTPNPPDLPPASHPFDPVVVVTCGDGITDLVEPPGFTVIEDYSSTELADQTMMIAFRSYGELAAGVIPAGSASPAVAGDMVSLLLRYQPTPRLGAQGFGSGPTETWRLIENAVSANGEPVGDVAQLRVRDLLAMFKPDDRAILKIYRTLGPDGPQNLAFARLWGRHDSDGIWCPLGTGTSGSKGKLNDGDAIDGIDNLVHAEPVFMPLAFDDLYVELGGFTGDGLTINVELVFPRRPRKTKQRPFWRR